MEEKTFRWKPEDKFELSGLEFSLFVNVVREILSTAEAQRIVALLQLDDVLQKKLNKAVEEGVVITEDTKLN